MARARAALGGGRRRRRASQGARLRRRAGRTALAQLAPDEAVSWFEQALSIQARLPAPTRRPLASFCSHSGRGPAAGRHTGVPGDPARRRPDGRGRRRRRPARSRRPGQQPRLLQLGGIRRRRARRGARGGARDGAASRIHGARSLLALLAAELLWSRRPRAPPRPQRRGDRARARRRRSPPRWPTSSPCASPPCGGPRRSPSASRPPRAGRRWPRRLDDPVQRSGPLVWRGDDRGAGRRRRGRGPLSGRAAPASPTGSANRACTSCSGRRDVCGRSSHGQLDEAERSANETVALGMDAGEPDALSLYAAPARADPLAAGSPRRADRPAGPDRRRRARGGCLRRDERTRRARSGPGRDRARAARARCARRLRRSSRRPRAARQLRAVGRGRGAAGRQAGRRRAAPAPRAVARPGRPRRPGHAGFRLPRPGLAAATLGREAEADAHFAHASGVHERDAAHPRWRHGRSSTGGCRSWAEATARTTPAAAICSHGQRTGRGPSG